MNGARFHEARWLDVGRSVDVADRQPGVRRIVQDDTAADHTRRVFREDLDQRPQIVRPGIAVVVGEREDVAARVREADVLGAGQCVGHRAHVTDANARSGGKLLDRFRRSIRGGMIDDHELPVIDGKVEPREVRKEFRKPRRPIPGADDDGNLW